MVLAFLSPNWFFGYDIALELLFSIITFTVSLFAIKIYKKTSQKQVLLFGISFLLISISYVIQTLLNFLIVSELNENVCQAIKINSVILFNQYGMLVHIFFMTIGLAILAYTTLKTPKQSPLYLLIVLSLLGVFLSRNVLAIFYVFTSIFLIAISLHYITNYLKNKKTSTLLVAIAFILLLIGNIHFFISVNHQLFYALGHILEFFAYLLILINLYLVTKWRKGKGSK